MKTKLLITGLLMAGMLTIFASCKKDKDTHPASQEVNGTFHAFEVTINGETRAFPTADEKMDVTIKSTDEKHADVVVIDYYKNNMVSRDSLNRTIGKTDNGLPLLTKKSPTGEMTVKFYDKNTIDLHLSGGGQVIRLGASKDGKKPDGWD